jgi:hypothetical protein
MYVVQPSHPMYGREVTVVGIRGGATAIRCIIADPQHPSFHYHIRQRWLSATAPTAATASRQPDQAVAIALSALDRLVQYVLANEQYERNSQDESNADRSRTDLAADTPAAEGSGKSNAVSDRDAIGRRM